MKKIIFIRTAPYLYKLPKKSLYASFNEVGLRKTDPHIQKLSEENIDRVKKIIKKYKPDLVLCSQFIRSQETARLFSDNILIFPELNEIKFSMEDFSNHSDLPNNKFDSNKINSLRYDFSQALINDQLQECMTEITARITNFINVLDSMESPKNIICCSHGFIMKLFENYLLSNKNMKNFKSLVSMHDWRKPTYDFLEGFTNFSDSI